MTAKKTAGHSAKHVSSSKHHVTSKHSPTAAKKPPAGTKAKVHAKGTHAHHAKARGFAVGDLLPVCAFEAVAQSLRLQGERVTDDVAGLWELFGEVSIPDAALLMSEARGVEPPAVIGPLQVPLFTGLDIPTAALARHRPARTASTSLALILGVDVPGPHAVLATADGWWSWGELHDPWPCRIEEAWAVSWS